VQIPFLDEFSGQILQKTIGGAHQQPSERAAPPVSVEEKGKTTGEKKKIAIISAYKHTKLKLTYFMLIGGPQNTIKSHLVFTALFCFAPFSVFSSRMSAPYCSCEFLLLDEFTDLIKTY
jgi:hypothetical protein